MSTIYEYLGSQGGTWQGADNVYIGTGDPEEYNYIYGDVTEYLMGDAQGGNDTLTGGASYSNTLYGDAWWLDGAAQGGDDILTGGASFYNTLYGDAWRLTGSTQGGNDTLTGGVSFSNYLYGDGYWLLEAAQGGNDTLTGGDSVNNILYGDAVRISGDQGGNDTITGGDGSTLNVLTGDGAWIAFQFLCGNDTLTGGDGATENFLYGDAYNMNWSVVSGDDILIAGDDSTNYLWGDAKYMRDDAVAGDDVLISGTGVDHMWGDAEEYYSSVQQRGSDTFVFWEDNGADTIYDFEQGVDVIDLTALDLPGHVPLDRLPPHVIEVLKQVPTSSFDFAVLDSNSNGHLDDGDDYVSYAGGGLDTIIDLGAAAGGSAGEDTVTILGVVNLTVDDFLF